MAQLNSFVGPLVTDVVLTIQNVSKQFYFLYFLIILFWFLSLIDTGPQFWAGPVRQFQNAESKPAIVVNVTVIRTDGSHPYGSDSNRRFILFFFFVQKILLDNCAGANNVDP